MATRTKKLDEAETADLVDEQAFGKWKNGDREIVANSAEEAVQLRFNGWELAGTAEPAAFTDAMTVDPA